MALLDDVKLALRISISNTAFNGEVGYDNPDADRLRNAYDMLKAHLTLSQEYTVGDAP
jgi:hypothetical protein